MISSKRLFLSSLFFSLATLIVHAVLLYFIDSHVSSTFLVGHLFFLFSTTIIFQGFLRAVRVMLEKAGFVFVQIQLLKAFALLVLLAVLEKKALLGNFNLINLLAIYLSHLFFSLFIGVKLLGQANKNISSK